MKLRDELTRYRAWLSTRARQTIDRWDVIEKLDALLSTADSEQREPVKIRHTVGENDDLYRRYGIRGSLHIPETEALCEVIRQLETRRAEQREVSDLHDRMFLVSCRCNDAENEVSDLRRQVKEYADAHTLMDEDMADLRRQLAASSLANAALREAWTDEVMTIISRISDDLRRSEKSGGRALARLRDAISAALSLPADSLAQEVVKYMVHKGICDKAHISPPGYVAVCTCGLDALLARIGGKP